MELYVDGARVATGTAPSGAITVDRLTLGARRTPAAGLLYDGLLDEIAIWNRALSSNEVSEIYNNGKGRFYTP